jgi:bifunctional non-homologous end joining protein LigD
MPTKVKHHVDVDGRQLALTNLDKVLYPGNGFTKAHVIEYYTRVAPWLLPHFARRPVTLLRFPDGVRGKAFYEKDAPKYTPEWVQTTEVPRLAGGKPIRYICVNDLPTLVWCANIASLELHPFLHRAGDLNGPTSLVFDLDPGEGADVVTAAAVALLLRTALHEKAGLECCPKVSGSKGIQVYAPLNTPITYAETRAFANSIAQLLERQHPDLIVSEMAKELRRRKVFIDWSQNSDFKTTVGVYSLRAKNDVPYVSAPVTWTELEEVKNRSDAGVLRFGPDELLKRLQKIGDLFAPLLTLKQTLSRRVSAAKSREPETAAAESGFVEPMLLLKTNKLPEGKNWLYEIKLDGYRAMGMKTGGEVDLRSRNDKDFRSRYATIVQALENLPDETVVDGEVVALDEEGRPSFNLLQNYTSSRTPIVYYVFDLLRLRGKDMMNEPLIKRREVLAEKVLVKLKEPIRFSVELEAGLPDLIRSVKSAGLEGLVAKRRDSV